MERKKVTLHTMKKKYEEQLDEVGVRVEPIYQAKNIVVVIMQSK